jgi:hypothetical protein
MESPISSEMNEEESEKDVDFVDDYDSEEEKRQRKKRKVSSLACSPFLSISITCHTLINL